MAKYFAVSVFAALICIAYVASADVVNDYDVPGYEECKSKLDGGAPRCFDDVYFKLTAPTSGRCCRNYLEMESSNRGCFDLLFDDPTTWIDGLVNAFRRCKEMLTAPAPAPYPYTAPAPAPDPYPYPFSYPAPAAAPALASSS